MALGSAVRVASLPSLCSRCKASCCCCSFEVRLISGFAVIELVEEKRSPESTLVVDLVLISAGEK